MVISFKAHFDGKVIVPDEPVDLPVDQPLSIEAQPIPKLYADLSEEEWHAALDQLVARAIPGLDISDESLRRENLYEERR
jgi:hypothetical protein